MTCHINPFGREEKLMLKTKTLKPERLSLQKFRIGNFINIYLLRKIVCFVLFCFVVMRSTEPGCFRSCSWCLWKALDKEGCMDLVPCRLDVAKVLEY
jgi:hypothetical protein